MKNSTTTILLAVTLAFSAFVGGYCLGRNTSGTKVEVSAYAATTAPSLSPDGAADSTTGETSAENTLININTATKEQLESLPKIGPTKAQSIIDYRETFGPFNRIEDIMDVSGIGAGIYEAIMDHITV